MYVVVNGGGAVGIFLARTLHQKGHSVAVVEQRSSVVRKLAEELPTDVLVIEGDGCDARFLRDAGTDRADVFAAVTRRDEVNLISCQLAREHFGVKRAVARVSKPRNERVFHALGIEAISSTTIISRLVEEEVTVGDIIRLATLQKGQLALVETQIPMDSGGAPPRTVAELGLPEDLVLVSVLRGETLILPRGSTVIEPGDRVLAVTRIGKEDRLGHLLRFAGGRSSGKETNQA
jgi:trk system potassium uptake protein TrkA